MARRQGQRVDVVDKGLFGFVNRFAIGPRQAGHLAQGAATFEVFDELGEGKLALAANN